MFCRICTNISDSFCGNEARSPARWGPDDVVAFQLGSYAEIRHRAETCPSCRQILDIYEKAAVDDYGSGLQIERRRHGIGIRVYFDDWSTEGLKSLHTVGNQEHEFLIVKNPHIDLSRLRTWLNICDESHHGRCHHLPNWQSVELPKDLMLIDTEHGCLVQCPGTTRYFALSYVWGHIPDILETNMSNVENLMQNGAFTSGASMVSIPQTIRDSMKLVRALNERYLWVDRFCIVQDDPAKHATISRMDSIYANAYCTIVAADGNDADYGLRGVQLARTSRQQMVNLPQCCLVTETALGSRSKYHTRGWTYQEGKLSARQLVFANETVFWACQSEFWKEEMCGQPEDTLVGKNYSPWEYKLPYLGWPDLDAWDNMCWEYNWKDLSYQEDAHVAFSGIERVIERYFPAGFLYGLPEFFFDLALLWHSDDPQDRRVKPSTDNGYYLPSWSWLGWQGGVSLTPWIGSTHKNLVMDSPAETAESFIIAPLIHWVQFGPTEDKERRVRNDYHLWRAHKEKKSASSTGWESKTTERGTVYTNPSISEMLFRYPFPLPAEMPPEGEQRTWPPYLRLRSHRAFFTIRPCHFDHVPETMVSLADTTGRWAGILFGNCDSQDAPFGEICELVSVSKGSARQLPEGGKPETVIADLYWDELPKTDGLYEFYNVLWVKWEGDHVVREGVGRVEKSIWEQQELEPIDTQLH